MLYPNSVGEVLLRLRRWSHYETSRDRSHHIAHCIIHEIFVSGILVAVFAISLIHSSYTATRQLTQR